MDNISNVIKRCIEEKITILTSRSNRGDRQSLNSSLMMSRVKGKDNQYYQFMECNTLNQYEVELAYQTELEYKPKFLFQQKEKEKQEILSDLNDSYELPKINFLDQQQHKKNSMKDSMHDSSSLASRRNSCIKYRTFSNRLKAIKVGFLAIDPESLYTQELFKQLCMSSVYQEITKQQLANYLSKKLGPQPCIIKLLNQLKMPYSISFVGFKTLLLQIRELTQEQIITIVFNSYDILSKGFLNTRDIFDLFKYGGAVQRDAEIMFKFLRFQQIRNPFETTQDMNGKKSSKGKRSKFLLITMMKEKSRRLSDMFQKKQHSDKNTVQLQTFMDMYSHSIPEIFKDFVFILANYNSI